MLRDGVNILGGGRELKIAHAGDGARLHGRSQGKTYDIEVDQLLLAMGRAILDGKTEGFIFAQAPGYPHKTPIHGGIIRPSQFSFDPGLKNHPWGHLKIGISTKPIAQAHSNTPPGLNFKALGHPPA